MKYQQIKKGIFRSRPNRFIAYVTVDGKEEKVHVKNTGRCRELLREGAAVYLEHSEKEGRSTAYDLVAVEKELGGGGVAAFRGAFFGCYLSETGNDLRGIKV